MNKWQIGVGLLLIFAVGTAVGSYGSRMMFKKRVSKVLQAEGTPSGIRVVQRMVERLDLSDAQRSSINAIIDNTREEWEELSQEYEPQIKALFESVIEEAKKELTDEQREEMEQMSASVRRRLPSRSFSPPGSASPPRSSSPRDQSSPPPGSQPFGPKPELEADAPIVDQLQLDEEKAEEVQEIIQSGIQNQEALADKFLKSQEAAEDKFRKEMVDEQLRTEKKLADLLTPEQLETYRNLMNPEEPRPEDLGFDGPPDGMNRRGPRQEEPPNPSEGAPGETQGSWRL